MRGRLVKGLVLSLFLASATVGTPAVALSPDDHAAPATSRAYGLIGTWSCRNDDPYLLGIWKYSRDDDGSISVRIRYLGRSGERHGQYRERFTFDSATGLWNWSSENLEDRAFSESGTAPDWTDGPWIISGTESRKPVIEAGSIAQPDGYKNIPQRVVYFMRSDGTFRREFQNVDRDTGKWFVRSGSTCTRTADS